MATTASIPAYLLPGVTVHQPPHLEGDASLATEILPGPPSLVSAQQAAQKRDAKKPTPNYSYLPPSDPGSTYSGIMHGTLIGQDHEKPHNKRSRIDKGSFSSFMFSAHSASTFAEQNAAQTRYRTATGRAQRASARNQGAALPAMDSTTQNDAGTSSLTQPVPLDSDSAMLDEEHVQVSRGGSTLNGMEPTKDTTTLRKKDKGKGKEVATPPLRVKEEPKTFTLHTPEPSNGNLLNNEDHCSSCRSYGSLVYCDGCPRAFHLWCLDPPLEGVDEGDARWFCPMCVARKHPPRKPPSSLLSNLIHNLQASNPVEFQLPDDIKYFFKDVTAGPKGNYVDASEVKPPRLNRLGQLEDRDPHRLKDRNGDPVLCFRCGTSALPSTMATCGPPSKRPRRAASKATSPDAWKNIISCDYCNLHWHLDCLDPPLPKLPPFNKKWMCPNHVERVLPPKRRIPKQNAPPIEITKSKQFNNGNIEVIHPEPSTAVPIRRVPVDEVLINGRRYRVPERIIILDFWNKLNKHTESRTSDADAVSILSSPLTSLSSFDESDDSSSSAPDQLDDLTAAQMLCSFASAKLPGPSHGQSISNGISRVLFERGTQTDAGPPAVPVTRNKVGRPRKHALPAEPSVNGSSKQAANESSSTPSALIISTIRRRRAPAASQSEPHSRELRSRSKNNTTDTPLTSISSRSSLRQLDDSSSLSFEGPTTAPVTSQARSKPRDVLVKLEESDTTEALLADPTFSTASVSKRPARTPRQSRQKEKETEVVRRGRKRKQRDDELPSLEGEKGVDGASESVKKTKGERQEKTERESRKSTVTRTPSRLTQLQSSSNQDAGASPAPAPPTTPSLKIRLPPSRFNNSSLGGTSGTQGVNDSPMGPAQRLR